MKEFNFTPGEYTEAQAKKEEHDRAREQARAYKLFLDLFCAAIIDQIERDLKERAYPANSKLGDFANLDSAGLDRIAASMFQQTKEVTGTTLFDLNINTKMLATITPQEFSDYIETLKKTLAK